jgi:hypothetical protein
MARTMCEQIALAAESTESSIAAFSNFLLALKEVGWQGVVWAATEYKKQTQPRRAV